MNPLRRHQVNRRGENIDAGSSDPDSKDVVVTEETGGPKFDGSFPALQEVRSDDELLPEEHVGSRAHRSWGMRSNRSAENRNSNAPQGDAELGSLGQGGGRVVYKVYKRRWFGMIQLALLNIIVSWDVSF